MSYQISDKLCFGFLLQKEKPFSDTDVFMVKDAVFCLNFSNQNQDSLMVLTGKYAGKIVPNVHCMKDEDHFALGQLSFSQVENLDIKTFSLESIQDVMLKKCTSLFWLYSSSDNKMIPIKDKEIIEMIVNSDCFSDGDDTVENYLANYGEFLTDNEYLVDPAVGREEELHQLIIALLSQEKSALLVGPPGVGKTALVEGLAYRLQKGDLPKALAHYQILKVNISRLLSGTRYRGDFEERVEDLLCTLQENPNILLFIDELHTAIGAGSNTSSNLDFANIIKPYLDRGLFKVIGATTNREYDLYIDQDPALKRRFKKIDVKEPNEDTLRVIFDSVMNKLSQKTNLIVPFDDNDKDLVFTYLLKITEKARRVYDDMLFNPDLALSIMDTAFACALASNQETIKVENFAEAMRLENRIYPSTRELLANELLVQYDALQKGKNTQPSIVFEQPKQKIILFDQLI